MDAKHSKSVSETDCQNCRKRTQFKNIKEDVKSTILCLKRENVIKISPQNQSPYSWSAMECAWEMVALHRSSGEVLCSQSYT
jgi:hypothetical protein